MHDLGRERLIGQDRVQTPRLYIGWPTVGERNDDKYALDVMFEVLYGSRQARTSRLNKALVYEHFRSKDDLVAAVVVRERDRLVVLQRNLADSREEKSTEQLRLRTRAQPITLGYFQLSRCQLPRGFASNAM